MDEDGQFITRDLRKWTSSAMVSTHCELTLALHLFHLFRHAPKPGVIELGLSKPCCWPCSVFLDRLTFWTNVRIVVSGAKPMTRGDWRFPEGMADKLGELIGGDMVKRAQSRLEQFIFEQVLRRYAPMALCSEEVNDEEERKVMASLLRRR
jgi:hypothetical protein